MKLRVLFPINRPDSPNGHWPVGAVYYANTKEEAEAMIRSGAAEPLDVTTQATSIRLSLLSEHDEVQGVLNV